MNELTVGNVNKWLGGLQILKGASFEAQKGSIAALLGASGSGKSTLLRCIAGLEHPEEGEIIIGGSPVLDAERGLSLPPERRNLGLVFQSYALWPHRTVRENVGYGLKLRKVPAAEMGKRVDEILQRMGLAGLADRYPSQLSGGQQQRVAICRSLVYKPRVLLLDEPLSNLDVKLREEARYWIRKLILQLEICAIMVTHDQSEALAVADQLLLLQNGRIVQQGTPQEIYSEPNCFYSADFLGANNVIKGKILSTKGNVVTLGGENWSIEGVSVQNGNLRRDDSGHAVIRIEKIDLSGSYAPEGIEMQLDDNIFLGDRWEYRFHRGDLSLKAFGAKPIQSKQVWAKVPNEAVWVFSEQ